MERIAELLDMLADGEPHLPTPEDIISWDMHPDASDWEPTFRKKRRHLVWLFQTALKLEEDLECWI